MLNLNIISGAYHNTQLNQTIFPEKILDVHLISVLTESRIYVNQTYFFHAENLLQLTSTALMFHYLGNLSYSLLIVRK